MSNPRVRKNVAMAIANALESLEGRKMLTATPWNLATQGPLTQNWETTDLTVANDWTPVASIEGFTTSREPNVLNINIGTGGTVALSEPALSPAGTVGNGTRVIYSIVNSNITTAGGSTTGLTNGGPREMQYSAGAEVTGTTAGGKTVTSGSRTIALQPSDTDRDENYLKVYIDNSGKTLPVRVSYDLLDVDTEGNTSTTARQSVSLQYRLGNSGNFAYVEGSNVANAADFAANATGKATSVDVVLPSDSIGRSDIELRIITVNTSGSDQLVAVENLEVTNFAGNVGFSQSAYSVNEGLGTISVNVVRTALSSGPLTVDYAAANVSATGADYTLGSGTLSFAAGEFTKTLVIPINNDSLPEGAERFTITLSNPVGSDEINASRVTATVTIVDDDTSAPVVGSVFLNELVLNPADDDVGGEYVEIRGTPGLKLDNVSFLSIEGDGSESGLIDVVVDLSGYSIGSNGYLIIKASGQPGFFPNVPAQTTIVNTDRFAVVGGVLETGSNTFGLFYNPVPFIEGTDLDTTPAVVAPARYTGEFNQLPAGTTTLDLIGIFDTSAGGTSIDRAYGPIIYGYAVLPLVNGADAITRFPTDTTVATSPAIDPSQGNATAWYGGDLIDPDPVDQGAPDFNGVAYSNVNFSSNKPAGAVITPGASNYPGIANPGQFAFGPTRYTVEESAGVATVTVYRAGGTAGTVVVNYTTSNGTAIAGQDYTSVAGTLTFLDGETVKTFDVPLLDDATPEGAETFNVALTTATPGASIIAPGTARVTINKSDSVAPSFLLINELLTNPATTTETPAEFIELRGTPNTTLVDVYLMVFEGDFATGSTGAGHLDYLIDLTGAKIGSNGLLLVTSNIAGEGFVAEDPATGLFGISAYSSTGGGFESGSMTVLLTYAQPGATLPVVNSDYDPVNAPGRGTLNIDPSPFITVLDSLAYNDGGATDSWYSDAVLGPPTGQTSFVFGAVTRFLGDDRVGTPDAFYYGIIATDPSLPTATANLSKIYSSAVGARSNNFPANISRITPGGANVADAIPPTVVSAAFNPLAGQKIVVTFSEDVRNTANGLTASDFALTSGSTTVALSVSTVSSDGKTVTLVFGGTGGISNAILTDGTYAFTVKAGQVADLAGNALVADATSTFTFRNADFNNDNKVNFDDLLALAQNYDPSPTATGKTYAQGDANYDGFVNFDDLLALAQRYGNGVSLAAMTAMVTPAPAKAPAPATKRTSTSVLGTSKAIV